MTTLELVRIEKFVVTYHNYPGRPAKDRAAIARAFVAKMTYNLCPLHGCYWSDWRRINRYDAFVDGKVCESWVGYKLHLDVADGGIPISGLLTSASTHDSQAAIPLLHMSNERVVNLYDLMDAAYDVQQIHEASRQLGHVPLIDVNPRRNSALKAEIAAENKRCRLVAHKPAGTIRYHERSTVERVNARLKDEFGGRMVGVRGHAKVTCHLMFGILALTANQLMTFVT